VGRPPGVPISAILFGGRRASTNVPLVYEARDWSTARSSAPRSPPRRPPLPPGGRRRAPRPDRHAALLRLQRPTTWQHWLNIGKGHEPKLPKIFQVNWFRKDEDGKFLWPGFGDNSRVLKWVVERLEGEADAVETPIGAKIGDRLPAQLHAELDGLKERLA
jgi:phosphoenolpyruvate carboxykinase (GTP)